MKTIKAKILNKVDFSNELKTFNSIARIAFNRFQDGLKEKQVRAICHSLFPNLNCWFLQCAVKEGSALYAKHKDSKVIFGGKSNYAKYLKHLISKDEWKAKRTMPISIQGEKLQKGNRLFDFDLNDNKVFYKPSKGMKIEIKFNRFRGKIQNELNALQYLINSKEATVSIRFNNEYIWITYDENLINQQKYSNLIKKRLLGIDLNPNAIGISIIEFNRRNKFRIIHKEVIDTYELNRKNGKPCFGNQYQNNKRKHELIEICYHIDKLVNYWKCSRIVVEDLKIKSNDKGKGKEFNRLCNNVWCKNLVAKKLEMLALMHGYEFVLVNPCYSSFIGNILYGNENTPDMIASATEIARRGYRKFLKGWFYPRFDIEIIDEQWKQTLDGVKSWMESYQKLNKLKLKYRFLLLDYIQNAVFSKNYKKNKIKILEFHCKKQ